MRVTAELHIDFDLLREQKAILTALLTSSPFTKDEKAMADEAIEGILNLLDDIQDQAAKEYEEEAIFGVPDEG